MRRPLSPRVLPKSRSLYFSGQARNVGSLVSPKTDTQEDAGAGEKKRCPRCGFLNAPGALFCEHCGQSLSAGQQKNWGIPPYGGPQGGSSPYDRQRPGSYSPPPSGSYPPPGGIPGGPPYSSYGPANTVDPNEQIDGVTVGDLSKFVQTNIQYYVPVFLNLKHFHSGRFNFSAFLFPGAWMLYRKLYKVGSIITSAMFFIYIAYAYLFERVLSPLYTSLLQKTGITADTLTPSSEQIQKLSDLIFSLPSSQIFLLSIPIIVFVAQLAIMLVCGFMGNRMYLKQCLAKIGVIHKETKRPAEIFTRFQQEGGVNLGLAVCIGICYLILSYIPQLFY